MPATQMAVLFVLTVLMASLYMTPDLLIAAAMSAKEGSFMMRETVGQLFHPLAASISAIWCSCVAAGAIPRSI